MYDQNWYNNGDIVPDQVTPASDAIPLADRVASVASISNEQARRDHQHQLNISAETSKRCINLVIIGISTAYTSADHQHPLNTDQTVANKPVKDAESGAVGNYTYYTSSNHAHPLNVDQTVSNVPLVNATVAANGTYDYYRRNDYIHPLQLKYDANLTATKFIKTGSLSTEVLCANGDSKAISDISNDSLLDLNNQPQLIMKYIISEASEEEKQYYKFYTNNFSNINVLGSQPTPVIARANIGDEKFIFTVFFLWRRYSVYPLTATCGNSEPKDICERRSNTFIEQIYVAPCDFFLFGILKTELKGVMIANEQQANDQVSKTLAEIHQIEIWHALRNWITRLFWIVKHDCDNYQKDKW
ncbi:MAG: hypothetical protein EZS28_009518 [Streblomastix strix]|uniref:Uncharacterized protein n=1 Tax=Streblomastix strix TaxID=222440 RepID=A0A5J4WJX1_9EUKA|nr:MAG: hypothetical protein EZS28_009518 [Streblomastix strix]